MALKLPFFRKFGGHRCRLVAVEVRPDNIFLACLTGTPAAPFLASFQKIPLAQPLPEDGEAFSEFIGSLVREMGARGAVATTLLYRPDINLILTDAPDVPREEWNAALRWRVRDLLDFPAEEAVIDSVPLPLSVPGEGSQVFVAGARQQKVRNRVTALSETGLDPRFVDIPDMAQRNLSALLPEPSSGTCLLVLDEASPLISITKGGELCFSRQVGMAIGQEIGRVADELGMERSEARRHLAEKGLSEGEGVGSAEAPQGEEGPGTTFGELEVEEPGTPGPESSGTPEALTDFAERLALEVQRSLDYYDSRFRQAAIQKIYLCGEGARIQGLEAYLESALGLEFEFFDPLDYIAAEPGLAQSRQDPESPMHEGILAIGAGLRMMDPGQV